MSGGDDMHVCGKVDSHGSGVKGKGIRGTRNVTLGAKQMQDGRCAGSELGPGMCLCSNKKKQGE